MKRKSVLIIDDDADILESLSLLLDFHGYQVTTLQKSHGLTEMAELPDLVLLDVWLSGESGEEICKTLKAHRRTKSIPVIMFSAGRELQESAAACLADDFIEKPFEITDLISKIRRLTNEEDH